MTSYSHMDRDELFSAVTYTHHVTSERRTVCWQTNVDQGLKKSQIDLLDPMAKKEPENIHVLNRFPPHSDVTRNLSANNCKYPPNIIFGNLFAEL